MKGFITRTVTGLSLCMGLTALVGCACYRDIVDPCWPERYNAMARQSVREIAGAQAEKGHVLDQTVWNWMFETDPKTGAPTERLNGAGLDQLRYISRRLPVPDSHLYVQNAQDILYVDGLPAERLVEARNDLNNRRMTSIQRFMATQTMVHPVNYQIAIHDFAPPGIPSAVIVGTQAPAAPIQGAYQKLEANFHGKLPNIQTQGGSSSQ